MGVSHQKGWVRLRGRKWHGCFRRTELDPKTKQSKLVTHSFVLGLKSGFTKSEAREKLEDEIAKLGGRVTGDQAPINGSVTFGWFVKNRYMPLKEGDWREETAKVKKYLIQADLVDFFEGYRLENFDRIILQTHLNQLARTRSRDRVLQIRAYVRDIFAEAVDQGFLAKDPVRKLKPPANLRATDKTVLTWDHLAAAVEKLGLRVAFCSGWTSPTHCVQASCSLPGGSAITWRRFRSPFWRRSTRGRSDPTARRREACGRYRSRRTCRKTSCSGERSARSGTT